ncbi:hypothetical protein EDB83DRAFT_397600 [Lactarius deliciosus]|nr:hypothetical protein EDB83DRAFT_397600 [Lactarius deliciosus]
MGGSRLDTGLAICNDITAVRSPPMDFSSDRMAPGVFQKNSSHPSSSWEEYCSHENCSSTNFYSFRMSYTSLPSQDPSLTPGGILIVGHPSPTSQHVPAQATSYSMASSVPPGPSESIPSSSFCPPYPHRPGYSHAPSSYPQALYDPLPEMSSVSPERLDMPVSRIGPAGHIQPSYPTPMRCRNRASASRPNAQPPLSKPFVRCPDCGAECGRPQDAKRHLLSHLPCWIACSFDGCTWRGYRPDTFRKHWHSEHRSTSQVPDEVGSKLYEPGPLVEGIVGGSVSMGDAENRAITWIKNIALALDKQELFMDPWGRKGRPPGNTLILRRGRRQYPSRHPSAFSSVPPAKLWASTPTTHPYPDSSRPRERSYL